MNDITNATANGSSTVAEKSATELLPQGNDDKKAAAMAKMSQTKSSANGRPKGNGVVKRLPIGEGETATRSIEVLGDRTVKASYTFKLSETDKQRYGVTTLLDYTNCSMAEILDLATRSIVITLQRNLRQMGDGALDASVYQNIDVKRDLVETQRSTMDGETRDLHAFARAAKMSPDAAREILAAIAAGTFKVTK